MSLYFDYAATAPVNAEILDKILSDNEPEILFEEIIFSFNFGFLLCAYCICNYFFF